MSVLRQLGPILLVGAAALAGCAKGDAEHATPAATQGGDATPAEPLAVDNSRTASELSDNQILGVLAAVDAGEIEQARYAFSKSGDPRVKDYAEHMIEQHTASTQEISALAADHSLAPAASNNSTNLQLKGQKILDGLKAATTAAFDATYMSTQVQQHQEVLDMLHSELMPASRSDAVSARLKAAHSMVQMHLNEARRIEPLLNIADNADPSQPSKTMPVPAK